MGIRDCVLRELSAADRRVALEFIDYLEASGMEFLKDEGGYWQDKAYYRVNYNGRSVCFISVMNPEEPENRWTVWSADLKDMPLDDSGLRQTAWKYVDMCRGCGSCSGGRRRVISGREFADVCGCTFRVDNPEAEDLPFLKYMVEMAT